ncbi:hypothetical protein PoB_004106200 [Plakobranchus ocellatus]|uniref:Uncharacterized protein n=1 Tax=Plakobranchus ocellatus TaxID=259542 RepID=A0AAV4B4W9_9GAST|nr:hypothetical protein PoB_004106200 [Plakobranchus ocellatus]
MDSEPDLGSAGILPRVRVQPPVPWPDGGLQAARPGRHEYGSKYVAGIPPATHAVGGRQAPATYPQIRAAFTSPESRATLTMPFGYLQLFGNSTEHNID